jgi:hypothetical protein
MAAPDYVPVLPEDRPRTGEPTPPARPWKPGRPGDSVSITGVQPQGPRFGRPGPDLGYALTLASLYDDRLQLRNGEDRHDVVIGCVSVAMERAALFGRAPVVHDLELAFTLFGFVGGAPDDLAETRNRWFAGAAHDYHRRQTLADRVPQSTLRLTPAHVRDNLARWRELIVTD